MLQNYAATKKMIVMMTVTKCKNSHSSRLRGDGRMPGSFYTGITALYRFLAHTDIKRNERESIQALTSNESVGQRGLFLSRV